MQVCQCPWAWRIAASRARLWLSVLERSGLVSLLEPWFGHAGRRLSCSPKLDWGDTGLLCWLIGIGREADLHRSPLVGAVWGELPSARDELRLRQVACGLPAGSVASSVLICRTPHSLPLGEGLNALPLSELTSHWCSG